MSEFYKMNPARWDTGCTHLTLEQEAAYLRIINAIHLHDEPIPDHDKMLAGMFRCDVRKAKRLKAELVAMGKIAIANGRISNDRADDELRSREALSEVRQSSGRRGGEASGASRRAIYNVDCDIPSNSLKNNDTEEAIASEVLNQKIEPTKQNRIEENREEKKTEPSHSPTHLPREAGLSLDWDLIEARLRAAADWQNESAPGLCVVGPVIALIDAGASLELDVLPTVRALAPKCRARTSWKYFLDPIKDARDLRTSMAGPSARQAEQKPANGSMSKAEAQAFLDAHTAKAKSGAQT